MVHSKFVDHTAGFCPKPVMVQTTWRGTRTPTMSASSAAGLGTGPSSALDCCLMARLVTQLACLHWLRTVDALCSHFDHDKKGHFISHCTSSDSYAQASDIHHRWHCHGHNSNK